MINAHHLLKRTEALAYAVLFHSRAFHLFLILYRLLKKKHHAVILCYHRIVDGYSEDYLYKNASVHHCIQDFRNEIRWLSRWFDIISLDNLQEHFRHALAFTKPTVIITFDDGYKDNYEMAYPLLRRYHLPATIYLTAGLIGTDQKLWTDDVEFALLRTTKKSLVFPNLCGDDILDLYSLTKKQQANRRITSALKHLDSHKRQALIVELFQLLGVTDSDERERRMLNWQEVQEMSHGCITFGAHTLSHPILSRIPLEAGKIEIVESQKLIEEKIGDRVKHFAIPNGRINDFTEELKAFCVERGIETIVTMESGFVDNTSDPLFLRRVSAHVPIYCFAGELLKLFFFSHRYEKNAMVYRGANGSNQSI